MAQTQSGSASQLKTDHRNARSRRIVTGLDKDGHSTFVSDEFAEHRFVGDAFTTNMIWQVTSLPTTVTTENAVREISFNPPPNGISFVTTTFPPDSSYDYREGYAKSLADWGANHVPDPSDDPSMHTTDSIDIVTVISGEIWAVLETGEKLLKAGDIIVQRGTKHGWHNRSNEDCLISAVLMKATR